MPTTPRAASFTVALMLLASACDSTSTSTDAGARVDASARDAATTDAASADAGPADGGRTAEGCTRVSAQDWSSAGATDVDVEYRADVLPMVGPRSELSILFERYSPESPVGTFPLGPGGVDANFGSCAHCVFIGVSSTRAFFADRGTLVVGADPYGGRLDASLSGVRLVEVAVNPETRESTPIADGACVELADLSVDAIFPPEGWTCEASRYEDGSSCECECGVPDPDCWSVTCPPFDPSCVPRDASPISDCAPAEICSFDPERSTTRCTESCDWREGRACEAGTCVYSLGVEPEDTCWISGGRIDAARFGETCMSDGFQRVCAVEAGFARGYCDAGNICRPVCATSAECMVDGESCRLFVLHGESLGYCGPPPPIDG